MSARRILTVGSPEDLEVLHRRCDPVDRALIPDYLRLVDDMVDTMDEVEGVGLAAPQVGVPVRVIVVNTGPAHPRQLRAVLFNPRITRHSEGTVVSEEMCLSKPGVTVDVLRWETVSVAGMTRRGKDIVYGNVSGRLANIFQHEIDHLDGILIGDGRAK